MAAGLGDHGAAVGVADENRGTVLLVEHLVRGLDVALALEGAPENRECPEEPVVERPETFDLRSGADAQAGEIPVSKRAREDSNL